MIISGQKRAATQRDVIALVAKLGVGLGQQRGLASVGHGAFGCMSMSTSHGVFHGHGGLQLQGAHTDALV